MLKIIYLINIINKIINIILKIFIKISEGGGLNDIYFTAALSSTATLL
jgi:hypothetical protein